MITGGNIFTHKNIRKATWRLLDGTTMNQTDHVLIQKNHSFNLRDVRCKRVVNFHSDYHLEIAKVQARISMTKTQGAKC